MSWYHYLRQVRDVSRKESRFDSRYDLYLGGSCSNPHLCSAVISVFRKFICWFHLGPRHRVLLGFCESIGLAEVSIVVG